MGKASERYEANFGQLWGELQSEAGARVEAWVNAQADWTYNEDEAWEQAWAVAVAVLAEDGTTEDDPEHSELCEQLADSAFGVIRDLCE